MAIEDYMPDFAVEAVYDLTVESLKRQGIKAVLADLDNTLIAWNNPDGTPEMKKWLHDLRDAGIWIIVVSNNNQKRVKRAVEKFEIDYIYWAMKPFTRNTVLTGAPSREGQSRSRAVRPMATLVSRGGGVHRDGAGAHTIYKVHIVEQ